MAASGRAASAVWNRDHEAFSPRIPSTISRSVSAKYGVLAAEISAPRSNGRAIARSIFNSDSTSSPYPLTTAFRGSGSGDLSVCESEHRDRAGDQLFISRPVLGRRSAYLGIPGGEWLGEGSAMKDEARHYDVILAPVITEKATQGSEHNQVTFRVPLGLHVLTGDAPPLDAVQGGEWPLWAKGRLMRHERSRRCDAPRPPIDQGRPNDSKQPVQVHELRERRRL